MTNKNAVFFIHGILGKPEHFNFLFPYINENYAIYTILLSGHGGDALSFAHSSMANWHKEVEEKFLAIASKHTKITIVAHSMGALFAIRLALKYPSKIKSLHLLQPAFKIGIKVRLIRDCLKVYFNHIDKDDYRALALKDASSIKIDKYFYHYLLWIPRYLELFKESYLVEKMIKDLKTKTYVYVADDDEMLTKAMPTVFKANNNVLVNHLKKSTHDYYDSDDIKIIMQNLVDDLK